MEAVLPDCSRTMNLSENPAGRALKASSGKQRRNMVCFVTMFFEHIRWGLTEARGK
jgi:hypothetical protein